MTDTRYMRSVIGIAVKIAGGVVFYKMNFQSNVALSSTEAEFIAAYKVVKVILYTRSILDDTNIIQDEATTLYDDNQGALLVTNSGQPTKSTCHMKIKHFT